MSPFVLNCMEPQMPTFDDLFAEEEAANLATYKASQTPGTPEHRRAAALKAASEARDAARLARSLAAGLVVGVTCSANGTPLDTGDNDADIDDDDDADNDTDTDTE